MATAAVDLKDHVTCPVCLDVFNEPKILKCLHTICESCMHNLQRFNIIICPVCREKCPLNQIKSDFKTQALLDLYKDPDNKSSKDSKEPSKTNTTTKTDPRTDPNRIIRLCSLCKRHEIASYCCQCKVLICQVCKMSHNRIPSCSEHTFGFATYRKDQADRLLQAVNGLEKTGIGSPKEQLQFDARLRSMEAQAITEIKEAEQQALVEVRKHHQNLIGVVQMKKFTILSTREKQKQELKLLSFELRARVAAYAKEIQKTEDSEATLERITQDSQKTEEFEDEINRLKVKYSAEKCECRTVIEVRKEDYDEQTGTKIAFRERVQRQCIIQ